MRRAAHGSSGIVVLLIAALLGAGAATAKTAPSLRWTEAKAEARVEQGTYRVFDKGEIFHANNDVIGARYVVSQFEAFCSPATCLPHRAMIVAREQLAKAEAKLATAKAGRALTLASCKGYYGRLGPRYTRFKCEATLVGKTWKTGAPMIYKFGLRPGGWNGRPTKHGFRILGLTLTPRV